MSGIGSGLSEMFGCLITIAVIAIIGVVVAVGFLIFGSDEIETKVRVEPEIKVESTIVIKDGVEEIHRDTTYIYKPIK
jgi:hypothetical protein